MEEVRRTEKLNMQKKKGGEKEGKNETMMK